MLQDKLLEHLRNQQEQLKVLLDQPKDKFTQRPFENAWSAAECLAHLNVYARMYYGRLALALSRSPKSTNSSYSPGWLGRYVANAMRPLPYGRKMKTFRSTNPHFIPYAPEVGEEFAGHLDAFITLLEKAKDRDLGARRVSMSVFPLLRFKLGDMFLILIYHHDRHLEQALRAVNA
jgi:hypothetical protein